MYFFLRMYYICSATLKLASKSKYGYFHNLLIYKKTAILKRNKRFFNKYFA